MSFTPSHSQNVQQSQPALASYGAQATLFDDPTSPIISRQLPSAPPPHFMSTTTVPIMTSPHATPIDLTGALAYATYPTTQLLLSPASCPIPLHAAQVYPTAAALPASAIASLQAIGSPPTMSYASPPTDLSGLISPASPPLVAFVSPEKVSLALQQQQQSQQVQAFCSFEGFASPVAAAPSPSLFTDAITAAALAAPTAGPAVHDEATAATDNPTDLKRMSTPSDAELAPTSWPSTESQQAAAAAAAAATPTQFDRLQETPVSMSAEGVARLSNFLNRSSTNATTAMATNATTAMVTNATTAMVTNPTTAMVTNATTAMVTNPTTVPAFPYGLSIGSPTGVISPSPHMSMSALTSPIYHSTAMPYSPPAVSVAPTSPLHGVDHSNASFGCSASTPSHAAVPRGLFSPQGPPPSSHPSLNEMFSPMSYSMSPIFPSLNAAAASAMTQLGGGGQPAGVHHSSYGTLPGATADGNPAAPVATHVMHHTAGGGGFVISPRQTAGTFATAMQHQLIGNNSAAQINLAAAGGMAGAGGVISPTHRDVHPILQHTESATSFMSLPSLASGGMTSLTPATALNTSSTPMQSNSLSAAMTTLSDHQQRNGPLYDAITELRSSDVGQQPRSSDGQSTAASSAAQDTSCDTPASVSGTTAATNTAATNTASPIESAPTDGGELDLLTLAAAAAANSVTRPAALPSDSILPNGDMQYDGGTGTLLNLLESGPTVYSAHSLSELRPNTGPLMVAMLAHPDEFKNPSSFLKVYGDPACKARDGRQVPRRNVEGNWECPKCRNINYPRRFRCFKDCCAADRDEAGDKVVSDYARHVYGLYKDRATKYTLVRSDAIQKYQRPMALQQNYIRGGGRGVPNLNYNRAAPPPHLSAAAGHFMPPLHMGSNGIRNYRPVSSTGMFDSGYGGATRGGYVGGNSHNSPRSSCRYLFSPQTAAAHSSFLDQPPRGVTATASLLGPLCDSPWPLPQLNGSITTGMESPRSAHRGAAPPPPPEDHDTTQKLTALGKGADAANHHTARTAPVEDTADATG